MKIIRFDSVGGASGDMILGALIALGADRDTIVRGLESLLPGHFTLSVEETSSHGIAGVRARVALPETEHHHHCRGEHGQEHGHHHHDHHTFREIRALIEGSALPEPVKRSSVAVFALLAEVEGKIHGKAPEEVSFHEVGAVDSIVDIVGCCYGFHLLGAEAVSVSPLPTGQGTLECAHGVMPIPAPATAELLTRGLEIAPSDEPFELLTPTGAALLAAWPHAAVPSGSRVLAAASSFGRRELLHRPNLLRAMLIDAAERPEGEDALEELSCNLDDCTGEVTGYLIECLFAAGALDVWTEAIQMKKQRPGVKLCVLTRPEERETMLALIFRESTTLGVRIAPLARRSLARRERKVVTPRGEIRVKVAYGADGGVLSVKPEFEDCRRIAESGGLPLKEVIRDAAARFGNGGA